MTETNVTKVKLHLPRVIGHRGAAALAPENTLDSFAIAAHGGAKWIECNVRLSKDLVPVLMHDETLDRTTNGSGNVGDMNFDDLQDLEAGSWFSDNFAGIGIPSLEEAFDWCTDNNTGLLIDMRSTAGGDTDVAEAVLDLVTRSIDDPAQVLIASHSLAALTTALEYAPELPRCLLFDEEYPPNWEEIADYLHLSAVGIQPETMTEYEVERFVNYGVPVICYNVNNASMANQLFDWGVTSVVSSLPDLLED